MNKTATSAIITEEQLSRYTMPELLSLAKQLQIDNAPWLLKEDLISAIVRAQQELD